MSVQKCSCFFVPPQILENIAKSGNENARLSVVQSRHTRVSRSARVTDMTTLAGVTTAPAGKAARQVYDCQHKWQLRVKLVRGEGDPAVKDDAVNEVYAMAGQVRSFFSEVLNRNSIDNQGMNLILNVHYGTNYMNAFWDGDEMVFGDGDNIIFGCFTKSLDVIAHELTHGVTQYTAGLEYHDQPGALNEHFSDVFGSVITQYVNHQDAGTADWLIGDEIMGPTLFGEALRSMKAPGTAYNNSLLGKDPQPDHMNNYYTGTSDNGGVHINSGIPNRAFYLTASQIGTDKAGLIWYNALQNLWPTANFKQAAEVIVQAAQLLVKNKEVPVGSTQAVRLAFKEVGIVL